MKFDDIDFGSADIFIVTAIGVDGDEMGLAIKSQFTDVTLSRDMNGQGYLFERSVKYKNTGEEITQFFIQVPERHVVFAEAHEWVIAVLKEWMARSTHGRFQIFITSLDYFFVGYFGLAAIYGDKFCPGASAIKFCFIASDGKGLSASEHLNELTTNPIAEEFDKIYDLEQSFIYDNSEE